MLEESVSLWASLYSWFTPTVLFIFLNLMIGTIAITSSLATTKSTDQSQTNHHHHQIHRSPSVLQRVKSINFYAYRSPEPVSDFEKSPDFNAHLGYHHQTPNEEQQPASIEQNQPFLSRSPSVLQRIKSFNLYNYISQEPTSPSPAADTAAPSNPQETDGTEQHQEAEEVKTEEEETCPTIDEIYSKLNVGHANHVTRTKSDTEPAAGAIPPKLPRKMRKSASTKSPFAHFEENDVVEARRPATVREGKVATSDDGEATDEEVDAKADDFINRFKQQLKLQRIDSIMKYKEMVKKGNEK